MSLTPTLSERIRKSFLVCVIFVPIVKLSPRNDLKAIGIGICKYREIPCSKFKKKTQNPQNREIKVLKNLECKIQKIPGMRILKP